MIFACQAALFAQAVVAPLMVPLLEMDKVEDTTALLVSIIVPVRSFLNDVTLKEIILTRPVHLMDSKRPGCPSLATTSRFADFLG